MQTHNPQKRILAKPWRTAIRAPSICKAYQRTRRYKSLHLKERSQYCYHYVSSTYISGAFSKVSQNCTLRLALLKHTKFAGSPAMSAYAPRPNFASLSCCSPSGKRHKQKRECKRGIKAKKLTLFVLGQPPFLFTSTCFQFEAVQARSCCLFEVLGRECVEVFFSYDFAVAAVDSTHLNAYSVCFEIAGEACCAFEGYGVFCA